MLSERGLERAFEEMFDCEALGEVRARGLASARRVVEVHLAAPHQRVLTPLARAIGAAPVHREVGLREGQLAFEEPLVDRPELAHAQAAEVDGAEPLWAFDQQEAGERRAEEGVGRAIPASSASGTEISRSSDRSPPSYAGTPHSRLPPSTAHQRRATSSHSVSPASNGAPLPASCASSCALVLSERRW